jgi:hypothetical protein
LEYAKSSVRPFSILQAFFRVILQNGSSLDTIGSTLSWYLMNQWLQNFAYRTHLDWWIFLIAADLCNVDRMHHGKLAHLSGSEQKSSRNLTVRIKSCQGAFRLTTRPGGIGSVSPFNLRACERTAEGLFLKSKFKK